VFYRQLYYVNHSPQSSQIQDLNDTWMLRFSLAY